MGVIIFIAIIAYIIFYVISNKLNIDFKSFFHKGFKKIDNKFGLYLYTGKQGTGKTYSAIRFVERMKTDKTVVLTNIYSYSERCGAIYIKDFYQIMEYCKMFEKAKELGEVEGDLIIFFDEIFTVVEKAGALQSEFLSFISQMRKRGIIFVSTAQEWAEINITLRRYCRYQISCSMKAIPICDLAICSNLINDGDGIYWDSDSQEFLAPLIQTNIFKGNLSICNLYDTFETIDTTTLLNKNNKIKPIGANAPMVSSKR